VISLPGQHLRRKLRREDGSSLIIMLALLSFLGVLLTSVLTIAFASFKTTQVARAQGSELFGADGGIDYGIELLRDNTSYCPEVSGSAQSLPSQTVNGRIVQVTCQTLSGSATSGGGGTFSQYALVVTGYPNPNGTAPSMADGILVDGKTHADTVKFEGPVFNAGGFTFGTNSPVVNMTSTLDEYNDAPNTYCTVEKSENIATGNLDVDGAWTCRNAASFPVPDPLPTLIAPTASAPTKVVSGGCTIFFPGRYSSTTKPTFDKNNRYYFASGVYHFNSVGEILLAGEIFGGQPGAGESQQMTTATPCSNDAAANAIVPGSASGSGVQFILSGSSRLRLDDHQKDKIELFSRVPAVPANEGTPGVTVYAPRTSGATYNRWNSTSPVLRMDGNKTTAIIHGLWYTPNGRVDRAYALPNPGNAPTFAGGVVAQKFNLFFDNQSDSGATAAVAKVTPPAPPTPRTIVVTATAQGTLPGEAPTVIRAVVQMGATGATPPTVLSWRKV
jgi:hypothetical protein